MLMREAKEAEGPDLHDRPGAAGDPPAARQRGADLRDRAVPQALPAERPRRHRPDAREGPPDRPLRERAPAAPSVALSRGRVMAMLRNDPAPLGKVLLLPGDGIGPEVMAEVRRVMDWFAKRQGITFETDEALVGGASYDRHGTPLTDEVMAAGAGRRCRAVRRGRRPEVRRPAVRGASPSAVFCASGRTSACSRICARPRCSMPWSTAPRSSRSWCAASTS